jgi:endonuclease/exonuclease/phosphatase family metal-dependent hydrolase
VFAKLSAMARLVKLLLPVLLLVAVVAPVAQARPAFPAARVMTYNIHAGADADDVFDLDRLARQITSLHPDVVGLQEVDRHWGARSKWADEPAQLAARTGMHVFFAPIYSLPPSTAGAPRREFGVAVLSRSPILRSANHSITRLSTQEPNPKPAQAPGFAEALISLHGMTFRFYVTHLDYRADPSVRTAQVADMLRIMRPGGAPQVLVGDMNTSADAPELAPLREKLRDAWRGEGGFTFPARNPTSRLDQIYRTPGLHARHTTVPDTLASDHRPVVTDIFPW